MNIQSSPSLKESLKRVWLALGMIGFVASATSFLVVGYTDYRKNVDRIEGELIAKSKLIERRVSAELLVSRMSVAENVIQDLKQSQEVIDLKLGKGLANCGNETCVQSGGSMLAVSRKLSEPTPEFDSLTVSAVAPSFFGSLRLVYFLASFLPIFALFFIGIWIQRRILHRSLVKPIESLVGTAYRGEEIPSYWPSEFVELSHRLDDAFRERDQAMIGQMASGVLHDMKTYLHSVGIAMDLATEQRGTEKFTARLESLYKTCSIQIPKMKSLIESVLDGSREVKVKPINQSLLATLQSSVELNKDLAKTHGVQVELVSEDLNVAHDRGQLERAITNLVKNGIESFSEQESKKIIVQALKDELGNTVIAIEDSGAGITNPKKLFKPFKTTKMHGTGLGLVVTKKIVEAHQGTIEVSQSESLLGAKFTITLPQDGGIV